MSELGQSIRAARKATGLSQVAVAEALDWHQTTVSRIENGTQELTVRQLESLVSLLGRGVLAGTVLDPGGGITVSAPRPDLLFTEDDARELRRLANRAVAAMAMHSDRAAS